MAAKLYVPARTFAVMRTGNEVVVRSTSRPPVHVTDEPLTSAFQPGGEEAESIEMPGGALTESEIVSFGGRSFGVSNVISVSTPSSTNDGWMVTWAYAAAGNDQRHRSGEQQLSHGSPRCRAITIRWTSFVPSPISRIFWSR